MKGNRWLARLMPILAIMLLVTACSFGAGTGNKMEDEQLTLKVMYYDERSFFQQYGMLFAATHPHVDVEVVSTEKMFRNQQVIEDYNQLILDFIEEEQPDVVMLQPNQYAELARDGRLYELSKLISEESFDTEGLLPGMIDFLSNLSDGRLYGLSPSFNSEVVFYNKDLFNQHGIAYPQDQMSWDELLELSMRFPTDGSEENRIYGLKAGFDSTLKELAIKIASTSGLSFIEPGQMQVLINTDSWKSAFQSALDAFESNTIYTRDPNYWGGGGSYEEYLLQDLFIAGRLAMTTDSHYYVSQIESAQDYLADRAVQNWDIVTMPVDPNNPDASPHVNLSNIFAINANSPNIDAAEQFIRYLHSDEYARVSSKSHMYSGLPVRTKYIETNDDINMAAFFKLKPVQNQIYEDYEEVPGAFFGQFEQLIDQALQDVLEGNETLSNALDNLQVKAQEALLEAKKQEEEGKAERGEVESGVTIEVGNIMDGAEIEME